MPRYFFHVRKDDRTADVAGVDLPDIAAAQREAAQAMGDELKHSPDVFWNDEDWHIEVTDDHGLILFTVFTSGIRSAASQSNP